MPEDIGTVVSPCFHPGDVEHPFQRWIDLQHATSTVQDHHAFDHRGQHGQELGPIFGEFINPGFQLVRHMVERVGQEADFIP